MADIADDGFYLPDEITIDNIAEVRASGEQHITVVNIEQSDGCRFYLSKLEKFNSLTVALLIAWFRFAHTHGKSIVYIDVPHDLRNIIDVYGLDGVLPLRDH